MSVNGFAPSDVAKPERELPALELEVMKSLWDLGTATVGQVQIELRRLRPYAYTTVMTILDRLAKKGAVSRLKQGRGYIYTPVLDRDAALNLAVHRLVHDFFDDLPTALISHLQTARPRPNGKDISESPIESLFL
jgi:BlaI family transcriptional regulator, penicillinase repressor